MTCYKCGRIGQYSRDYAFDDKKCYKCEYGGHILKKFPKKNEAARLNIPPKPKAGHIR